MSVRALDLGGALRPWQVFRQTKSLDVTRDSCSQLPLSIPISPFTAQSTCLSLLAATPHLPTGSPHPSPHFTSQQNANVISTLQAGELMSPDGT